MSCPACGAALAPWRPGLDRCAACGTAVTIGGAPPADPRGYGTDHPRLARLARPVLAWFDRVRLRLLARVAPPPGRLLDAGAGRGRFVAAASAFGYEAEGLEPSPGAVEAASMIYRVRLHGTDIEEGVFEAGSLDTVALWHVLEHVPDPRGALVRVSAWLRPGGAVLVGVPNLASVQARLGGVRWFHLDLPRHRTHFTPAGVRALLEGAGFEVVGEHHVLAEHNPFGMWQTLVNLVSPTRNWVFRVLQRDAPPRFSDAIVAVVALPLAPVAALLELAAGLARRGGTIAVVARKGG